MTAHAAVDQNSFRRIIRRNIALPLGVGLATAAVFVALIAYLVGTMNWVEHSERVIGDANEMLRLAVDRESGMRGFLITGDEQFLAPYELGKPRFQTQLASLMNLVSDNPTQVERLKRIQAIQARWDQYADAVISQRRQHQEYASVVASGRGKIEFDETRREFGDFQNVELRLRQERADAARSLTTVTVAGFLFVSLSLSVLLAWLGRRELMNLSSTYGNALQQQAEQTDILQQQVWLRSGQRLLAEKVIGQQSPAAVGRAMLDFLAQYLDAAVAALYVRDRRDAALRRVAAYGFSQESELGVRSFQDAESLVGQAAASRRLIQLQRAGYLCKGRIRSRHECADKPRDVADRKRRAGERCRRTRLHASADRARHRVPRTGRRQHG